MKGLACGLNWDAAQLGCAAGLANGWREPRAEAPAEARRLHAVLGAQAVFYSPSPADRRSASVSGGRVSSISPRMSSK